MSTPSKRPDWLRPLMGLIAFLVVSIGLAVFKDRRVGASPGANLPRGPSNASGVKGLPDAPGQAALPVPDTQSEATVWVDVNQPHKVRDALFANEWAQQVIKEPLGRGFVGPWAPFLGSKGEDLKASFSGTVLSLFADQLLSGPFRVVWFSGAGTGPVVVVPRPSTSARAAYAALDAAAARGSLTAPGCPGGVAAPDGKVELTRWLLAEHSVYAALTRERMAVGRDPSQVLQAVCVELPGQAPDAADLEVGFAPARIGREEGELARALGLGKVARLQFGVEKSALVPRGLAAEVVTPGRLDTAPLGEGLLKSIPEDTSVLLTLQLKLPEKLSPQALKAYWDGGAAEKLLTRQVAILWSPRGDGREKMGLALLWSRKEDANALEALFGGQHVLTSRIVCEHLALGARLEDVQHVEAACAGKVPNALNAAPAVVAGLKAPASIGLGVHLGRLLPQLALDGYWSDPEVKRGAGPRVPPPEVESAKRQLESLPFLGFSGAAQEHSWIAGGFRS